MSLNSIILWLVFQGMFVYSNDKSAMYIDLLTTNPPSHSFVLTDPLGRKTGIKSFISGTREVKESFEEIQNSYVGYEGSIDSAPDENSPPINGRIDIGITKGIVKGNYTMTLYSATNTTYFIYLDFVDISGNWIFLTLKGVSKEGDEQNFSFFFDPTPGAPPPVLTKVVTFQTLRDDFNVALKLNQIGDDKFVKSLIKMIDIAEKLYNRCEGFKKEQEDNKGLNKARKMCYKPVIAILRMVVKRLEVVNKLCNSPEGCKARCKVSKDCDEEEAWKVFETRYRKDKDFNEFYTEWDKDEWHKHKKICKRFVTDDALEIISGDINWLIKSFGEEIWQDYKKEHEPYIPERYKNFFK